METYLMDRDPQRTARPGPQRPNIIVILTDDLGYGDLSCFGGPNLRTPHIDRIAAEGVRLTRFYANSPVCSPSRASLMTGRYPDLVGVPGVIRTLAENSWGYFSPDAVTLPDLLKRAGYHTALVGKWHLGLEPENHPCLRGFDYFHGFLGDMMDDYWTHRRHRQNYMRRNDQVIDPEGHATDLFTDWAEAYVRQQTAENCPFFLYLAYNAPHLPIQPPEEWLARVREREPGVSEKRARYIALIEHLDAGVGRLLEALDEIGAAGDTLVIFTSDNGGLLSAGAWNGPLRGEKQDMYEGGIRVPACVRWPDRIPAGTESDALAMIMDILPTCCEAAGVSVEHWIEGSSFLPVLMGQARDMPDRVLHWVRREGTGTGIRTYLGQEYYAVRRKDAKLLHNGPFQSLELYDLAEDEREIRDLAGSAPHLFRELGRLMQRQVQRAGAVPWQKG